jgi:hypothetical protein
MRRLPLLLLAVVTIAAGCTVDLGQPPPQPLPAPRGNPSATCPAGWLRVSNQAWLQADENNDGMVDFPQSLPPYGGGHAHEEFCGPAGATIGSGPTTFHAEVMTHQGFNAIAERLGIGIFPSGSNIADADTPDMNCEPKPRKCMAHVSVTADLPTGPNGIRFRLLPMELPPGSPIERWHLSTEHPYNGPGGRDGELGAKSWWDGNYANARFLDLSLFRRTLSGTVHVPFRASGDMVTSAHVHMDARFGDDDEGTVIARHRGEFKGNVPLDTTRFANGWHCLAIRTDADAPGNALHTGVFEAPILIQNADPGTIPGRGSCFPP